MYRSMLENVSRVINIGIVQRTPSNIIAVDVLKAMKEPTEEMLMHRCEEDRKDVKEIWQAMIDAAINEK